MTSRITVRDHPLEAFAPKRVAELAMQFGYGMHQALPAISRGEMFLVLYAEPAQGGKKGMQSLVILSATSNRINVTWGSDSAFERVLKL